MGNHLNTNNHYYAYYISLEEFKAVIKSKTLPKITYNPFILLEPIKIFDSNSFSCAILMGRLPYYEYHEQPALTTFNDNKSWDYISFSGLSNKDFYTEFLAGKAGVFTFNGVSFYKILDIRKKAGDEAELYLRLIDHLTYTEPNTAFMVMPFGNGKLNGFYKTYIRDFLKEKMNIKVVRSDDFTDNDIIIDTIYKQIEIAEFIICEITECNKNAFFEIGYAKGKNKQIILLAQRGVDLNFFDINHHRRIEYNIDEPVEMQEKLVDTIKTIREKAIKF